MDPATVMAGRTVRFPGAAVTTGQCGPGGSDGRADDDGGGGGWEGGGVVPRRRRSGMIRFSGVVVKAR
jgi:hypothetical protein